VTVERMCEGRCWEVALEGTTLRVGGLELDLEALSGLEPRRVLVWAHGERASLEPSDWLGAEVLLPARAVRYEADGEEVREVWEPLRTELVVVKLFGLPFGGEA